MEINCTMPRLLLRFEVARHVLTSLSTPATDYLHHETCATEATRVYHLSDCRQLILTRYYIEDRCSASCQTPTIHMLQTSNASREGR